jgi:hypothetical protein
VAGLDRGFAPCKGQIRSGLPASLTDEKTGSPGPNSGNTAIGEHPVDHFACGLAEHGGAIIGRYPPSPCVSCTTSSSAPQSMQMERYTLKNPPVCPSPESAKSDHECSTAMKC